MLLLSQVYRDLSIEILLWLLGAFVLGYILRFILGAKWRTRVGVLEKDLSALTAKANTLEADLSTAMYEKDKTATELAKEKSKNADLYFKLKACEESLPKLSGFPFIEVSDPKLNDLKIVEGIGPKLEELLKEAGVVNLAVMGQAKAEDIKAILDKGGNKYKLANPTTWPKQAQMAVDGKWDELKEWQDVLDGGKE